MREEPTNTSNSSIIRVHKDKNYTVMSNKHLFQKELSLKAKGLLCLILALPDDWSYSIAGLATMSNDGRDSVSSALKLLQKFGYVAIEKNREQGQFKAIYHIFENPEENIFTDTEKPNRLNRIGKTESENPQQLNTNKEDIKNQDTNNQLNLLKTDEAVFKEIDLYNLYKEICIHFPMPEELTKERKQRASRRIKAHPLKSFWEIVCQKAENSKFCRETSFFCFDWLIKNNLNSLKVYEGNYDDKRKGSNVATFPKNDNTDNNGKYSKCY